MHDKSKFIPKGFRPRDTIEGDGIHEVPNHPPCYHNDLPKVFLG
jgi:hypothetical protein